jgi:hypothetical protein
MDLSPDLYGDLDGPYSDLRVATITNSKFYSQNHFSEVPTAKMFTLLPALDRETPRNWMALKQCDAENVNLW